MGGLYCFTMAKRKRKTDVKKTLEFLQSKGQQFAKDLRNKATKWELSFLVKLRQTSLTFIFQHPVICAKKRLFILDFYFPNHGVAIELDGAQHRTPEGQKADRRRTAYLKKEKIHVIRFMNSQVDSTTPKQIIDILKPYATKAV